MGRNYKNYLLALLVASGLVACNKETSDPNALSVLDDNRTELQSAISGSATDVTTTTTGGTVLMGGGTDVDAAFRWMIQKSGGGDFVILRSAGSATSYNSYVFTDLGGVNSCETLVIETVADANNATIEAKIRAAEAVFIAGGDQAAYTALWKDTKVEAALNYLISTKKVPIGGTSAGCAIQGGLYYTAANGTIRSPQALANPYNSLITINRNDFLANPYLDKVITDTHYATGGGTTPAEADRKGRHVTFMARMVKDFAIDVKGIGVDEKTAVAVDANGTVKVFGDGLAKAYFIKRSSTTSNPETCVSGSPLTWNQGGNALNVYEVTGTTTGTGTFSLVDWTTGSGGTWKNISVANGTITYAAGTGGGGTTPPPSTGGYTSWIVGDPADVTRTTTAGTILMGGGTDVNAAMQWMIGKSGGGDIVVLRATGTDGYNSYINGLGTVNSVETILIDSRTVANLTEVETKIRNAEAVFIAGGDQWNYVNFWKDTKVEDALNYLRNTKGVVIGGTSAGCAIQGKYYYSAQNSSVTSANAIANPYNADVTIGKNDFLSQPFMQDLITDTHFNNPDRRGRLLTFMARMSQDDNIRPYGIGVEEATAVCIDQNGLAKVFGSANSAYFMRQALVQSTTNKPERCVSGSSLDWYKSKQAVSVYKVQGTSTGANSFNVSTWGSGVGGTSLFFYSDRGVFGTF
ncbi:MAG: hypothetical protein EAZ97_07360 [Bacteroidetes bacterium]|nr:MAG: hypothetical protein EAZ97_07360 [Bacteroidota bacterium]